MDDNEIRDALGKAVPAPPPAANDLEAIIQRAKRGKARWLGLALVVALVAGPATGLLIGLNIDDGNGQVTVASGNGAETQRDTADPEAPTASGSASAVVGSMGTGGLFGPEKLTPLFKRTTADGIAIRAYRADIDAPTAGAGVAIECAEGAPCPLPAKPDLPDECVPNALLRAGLSNEAAVEPGFISVTKLGADQNLAVVHAGYFGVPEGSPAAWVAVQTSAAVTTVRVTLADGSVDEMAPVEGYAVLARQTTAPPPFSPPTDLPQPPPTLDTPSESPSSGVTQSSPPMDPEAFRKATMPEGTVEALDGSGTVVATAALTDAGAPNAACMFPAPVPAPFPTPEPDQIPPDGGQAPGERPAGTIEPFPAPPVTTAS